MNDASATASPATTSAADRSAGPAIEPAEYGRRRDALAERLGGEVAAIFAGVPVDPEDPAWRPNPHFEYLTGIADEPGAILVVDPGHPVASRRASLFLRPLDPEKEKWDGLRDPIAKALRDRYGLRSIHRLPALGRQLAEAAPRSRTLACVHPFAHYDQPVSPDLELFRKVAERIPGVDIVDRTDRIPGLRAVKSEAEIAMIRHANEITRDGFAAAMGAADPGVNESVVQAHLEHAYRLRGSVGPAFGSIVGSGINSTVLHYRANDRLMEDGDLVCLDSGARWGAYGADVTRTFPVNGRFTDRQREIHDIVLASLEAGIAATKAGVTLAEIDAAARKVITDAGYGDAFIHSIGHHLGVETHDTCGSGPLEAGAVITIEPGIYLPDEAIGVRIEDDVAVTERGCVNLTVGIPRSADEIEEAMAG